jgi:hypothetical protein
VWWWLEQVLLRLAQLVRCRGGHLATVRAWVVGPCMGARVIKPVAADDTRRPPHSVAADGGRCPVTYCAIPSNINSNSSSDSRSSSNNNDNGNDNDNSNINVAPPPLQMRVPQLFSFNFCVPCATCGI